MKIIDLLRFSVQKSPRSIAIKNDTCEITYSKLLSDVQLLADYLKSKSCRPGVKVALILPNSAEYFVAFFSVSSAGGTIVPLSTHLTIYETSKFIKRAEVSIAITNNPYAKRLIRELRGTQQLTFLTIGYDSSNKLRMQTCFFSGPHQENENSDVALMVYTSGTTGLSKIVMLTDDQLTSNMYIYRAIMGFDEHNIIYCALLLHHIYCICAQILTHISLGDTFIVSDKPFFIKDFLRHVQTHKVTITAFVPYMAMLMADYLDPGEFNTQTLQYITLSGAKTPKVTYLRLTERFKHIKFINTYGMSEAGSRISIAAPDPDKFPIGSVGSPIPGVKVRITDENGHVLPADFVGEVQVKSSTVFKGYFNQSELTSETIVDGWLKTGDLGRLDRDGNLFLVGRKKDIIISGGDNIYPGEVEECLIEHPLVSEAAVVGMPDRRLQEVPCAFIVKKNYSQISPLELVKFCQRRLSSHKIPRELYFVKEIPKLGTSKIDRRRLKEIINSKLQVKL